MGPDVSGDAERNRIAKCELIRQARRLASAVDPPNARWRMDHFVRRWSPIGPAGVEHDGQLWLDFHRACEDFEATYEVQHNESGSAIAESSRPTAPTEEFK